jgi:hypothetical protein
MVNPGPRPTSGYEEQRRARGDANPAAGRAKPVNAAIRQITDAYERLASDAALVDVTFYAKEQETLLPVVARYSANKPMGGIKFGVEPSMIIDFNSGPTNASLATEVETCPTKGRYVCGPSLVGIRVRGSCQAQSDEACADRTSDYLT